MNNGFHVIDADRHVLEPSDLFDRYLPARFRGRVRTFPRLKVAYLESGCGWVPFCSSGWTSTGRTNRMARPERRRRSQLLLRSHPGL